MVSVPITNEKEIEKRNFLIKFIEKYFDYSQSGLAIIKEQILNPKIDEVYSSFIKDDGMRAYFDLPNTLYEKNDEGWMHFREIGKSFINEFNISYEDFSNNTFTHNKNKVKIFKFMNTLPDDHPFIKSLVNWYDGRPKEEAIKEFSEFIGKYKISDKNKKKIVVSLNPLDFLMVSTAESWKSCLNLVSEHDSCFWVGLPAMINDKNRAIIYETDGRKKDFFGIETDRFLSRSWLLLDDKNGINSIRFFPENHFKDSLISDVVKTEIKTIGNTFISKHPVEPIFNDSGFSLGIYIDNAHIKRDNRYYYGSSGFQSTHKTFKSVNYKGFSLYRLAGGIRVLEGENKNIGHFKTKYSCGYCSNELKKAEEFVWDETAYKPYCKTCFNTIFTNCSSCNAGVKKGRDFEYKGKIYCQSCKEILFSNCNHCGKLHLNAEVSKVVLDLRNDYTDELETHEYSICNSCMDQFLFDKGKYRCTDCGKIYDRDNEENFVEFDKYTAVCTTCYIDRKQIKFEFVS